MPAFPIKLCRVIVFLTLVSIISCSAKANLDPKIDSLTQIATKKSGKDAFNARLKLYWALVNQNPQKAKIHLDVAEKSDFLKDNIKAQAELNRCFGSYYSFIGSYDVAEEYLRLAIESYKKINEIKGIIACNLELGSIAGSRGNFKQALHYFLLVRKDNLKKGDELSAAKATINIGLVYYRLGDFKMADYYYNIALETFKKHHDQYLLMHIYSKKASNFLELKKNEEALFCLNNALAIAKQIGDSIEQCSIGLQIGSYHLNSGKPQIALEYYKNFGMMAEKLGLKQEQAVSTSYIGLCENELHNFPDAEKATIKGIELSKEIGDQWRVMNGYDLLSDIYKNEGNYKLALENYEKSRKLSDSLSGVQVKTDINELKIKYDIAEKEIQILKLYKQSTIKQDRINHLYLLSAGLGILLIILFLLTLLYIKDRKNKARLIQAELEQRVLRAQMNPHFIFNSLNSLQRMYIEGNENKANEYMSDFSHLLRSILENSGKPLISLKEELRLSGLYLQLEQLRTDHLFEYEFRIATDLDVIGIQVPPMLLQPYLENSIWHGIIPSGIKGKLMVHLQIINKHYLQIEICDNGVGIFSSQKHKKITNRSSLGMHITAQRIGGKNSVKTEELPAGGTKITLSIKIG